MTGSVETAAAGTGAATSWKFWCDGSAVPNPGRMGLGAVMRSDGGEQHTISALAEGRGCNNEAELRALMAALHYLQQRGAMTVVAHTDNSILVEQLGEPEVPPIARLAPLFDEARALLRSFPAHQLLWLPRHRNREADALARAALGLAPKLPARQKKHNK